MRISAHMQHYITRFTTQIVSALSSVMTPLLLAPIAPDIHPTAVLDNLSKGFVSTGEGYLVVKSEIGPLRTGLWEKVSDCGNC